MVADADRRSASGAEKIWFGRTARALRESITDGSYRYCSRIKCADIANRNLMRRDLAEAKKIIAKLHSATPPLPKRLYLSHDRSCNLSCPSCRKENIVADKAEQARLDDMTERVLVPLLRGADACSSPASGDPFFSNHFRRLIKQIDGDEFRHLRLDLHTNAQLFDERGWNDLRLRSRIRQVEISIDAATPETYAIVRRGGSFERLLQNLAFIKSLRDSGEIEILYFSMVVQTAELPRDAGFRPPRASAFSADWASFNMIWNWGTFTPGEFAREYVGRGDAIPISRSCAKVLRDPAAAAALCAARQRSCGRAPTSRAEIAGTPGHRGCRALAPPCASACSPAFRAQRSALSGPRERGAPPRQAPPSRRHGHIPDDPASILLASGEPIC